jgi:hypothetical protein
MRKPRDVRPPAVMIVLGLLGLLVAIALAFDPPPEPPRDLSLDGVRPEYASGVGGIEQDCTDYGTRAYWSVGSGAIAVVEDPTCPRP